MRRAALLAVAATLLPLAACASGESLSDRFAGSDRVKGDADRVRIYQASSVADALPLAIGHCSHFGRSAQYDTRADGAYVFRCVPG